MSPSLQHLGISIEGDRPTALPPASAVKFVQVPYSLEELRLEKAKRAGYKMRAYFPADGPLRRELYRRRC